MTHQDPLAFNFGVDFESSANRVKGEHEERVELVSREMPFNHGYLDDKLLSIMPHDLLLLGAFTGAGKTELARIIAAGNAVQGRNVFYFALEAEPREIERRTKYALVMLFARQRGISTEGVTYASWYRNRHESTLGRFNAEAEAEIAEKFQTLHTYYRGSKFTHEHIEKLFLAVQSKADLIILDHLHYVDIEDENENRGFKRTVQMIRDVSLGIGRAVLLIAHLRKRDSRAKAIVPDLEMFHGSSDIIKICTSAIMLAPAYSVPNEKPGRSNTFIHVPKNRGDGSDGLIAMCEFDRQYRNYGKRYTLGRQSNGEFEPLADNQVPEWAKHHRPMPVSMTPAGGF